jgi:integrase
MTDEEKPFYMSDEELKQINDLAEQRSKERGNEALWKVISYMALTGARLRDAIRVAGENKVSVEEVQAFMHEQGRLAHDLRHKWALNAQKINSNPQVIAKLLGHKSSNILIDEEEPEKEI